MTEISEEEKQLLAAFKALKVKPKADTPEDLQTWLQNYAATGHETPQKITVSTNQPRLSIFYGDTTTLTKGEATYDQWRYEIRGLLQDKTHKKEAVLQAIRRSVRGEASKILMRLGTEVTIDTIMEKFESVYGVVDTKESLLAKFYSAKQKVDEDITSWSCRLEDILSQAVDRKLVKPTDTNDMLRSMFWTCMRQDLKDISGYKFETVNDFDKFRVEIRKLEQNHLKNTKQTTTASIIKSEVESDNKTDFQELKGMVKTLTQTMSSLENRLGKIESGELNSVDAVTDVQQFVPRFQNPYSDYRRPPYRTPCRFMNRPNRSYYNVQNRQNVGGQEYQQNNRVFPGNCFKCGKQGHHQWECRANGNPGQYLN
ncbi:Hypothetical predicted protein [Mytilus galloprovincialis]|uniref:CCHC-type domain-containing protein n=1 Tax=Mytilus galloprovincialis TaxID=29158 RepID=A0A8B6BJS3_MYTGA|nr:Hypothetical predicted protein [Mytilus galloprovincialis]